MSATVYGTSYFYGISATSPSNSLIQSFSLTKSDANVAEVEDGSGAVVTTRTDDQRDVVDIELKIAASFSAPAIGSVLTIVDAGTVSIAGDYMILTSVNSGSTKDFKTFKITAVKKEYQALS